MRSYLEKNLPTEGYLDQKSLGTSALKNTVECNTANIQVTLKTMKKKKSIKSSAAIVHRGTEGREFIWCISPSSLPTPQLMPL